MTLDRLERFISRVLLISAAAFSVAAVLFAAQQVRSGALGPQIHIDTPEIDLGTLERNSVITGVLTIENRGWRTLKLTKVRSTCGCAIPRVHGLSIPPGESRNLEYTFSAAGRRGKTTANIYIASNDTRTPLAKVGLRAFVPADYYWDPQTVRFGDTLWHERKSVGFRLFPAVPSGAVPIEVKTSASFLKARTLGPPGNPKDPWLLSVSFEGIDSPGRYRENVFVTMSENPPRMLKVPVEITVTSDVEVVPASLFYGLVQAGRRYSESVLVKPRDGFTVSVASVTSNAPEILAVTTEQEPDGNLRITGTLTPTTSWRSKEVLVTIVRRSDIQSTIEIPAVFVAKPSAKTPP